MIHQIIRFCWLLFLSLSLISTLPGDSQAEETSADTLAALAAAGDADKGAKRFKKRCSACHVFDPAKKKTGPHLLDILGREAALVDGFKYSKAMKNSGLVWNADNIAAYLRKPKAFLPGNRMAFPGLKKEEQIANLLAFLAQRQIENE